MIEDYCIELETIGYGNWKINGRRLKAHRVVWEELRGPIPVRMCVLHHCDNPPCINVVRP